MLGPPPPRHWPFISRQAANYPPKLNLALAQVLVEAVLMKDEMPLLMNASDSRGNPGLVAPRPVQGGVPRTNSLNPPRASAKFTGTNFSADPGKVVWSAPMSQQQPFAQQCNAIGGLRHTAASMKKLSHVCHVGKQIFVVLNKMLDENPSMQEKTLAHLNFKDKIWIDQELAAAAEACIRPVLLAHVRDFQPPVASQHCVVNVELLDLWQKAAKDPDHAAVQWLLHGAPGGILQPIESCGIFPEYPPGTDVASVDPEHLFTPDTFVNYAGVEQDADAFDEITRIHRQGFVREFKTWKDVTEFLGAEPVLSKIGLIRKMRNGKMKTRLVVDSKQSLVSAASRKWQRTQLPRVLDAVFDDLDLLAAELEGEDSEHFIADFKDAFFIVPNHPSERKFFCI